MDTEILNFYVGGAMGYYEKPSPSNLETAQHLFQRLLQSRSVTDAVDREEVSKKWKSLGFTLKTVSDEGSGREFAVISECPKNKGQGNGFYVVNLLSKKKKCKAGGSSSPAQELSIVLQAVHTPSDLHIHKVAFKLLMESSVFVAAAWNTTHRRKVDLGKETMSYFNSFTAAVAKSFPRPRIVQLHAFDAKSHKISGDMILSSSRSSAAAGAGDGQDQQCQKLVSSIKSELKQFVILHFPKDIKVLGGTLNVNAKVFYDNNPDGLFVHVEMSMPLRLDLRDKQETRSSFTRSLASLA